MKHILLFAFMLIPLFGVAQQSHFESQLISPLSGQPKNGYQGMDIYEDYMVSCQNTGYATVYKFDGNSLSKIGNSFKLASYNVNNHCNVACFSKNFYDKQDKLPLIYISQCQKRTINGRKDVLYVERINPDTQTSELVQTIFYKDDSHNFGYALQWVIDNENNFLYGYGNTINNDDPQNKHRVVKFRLPEVKDTLVVLHDSDLLENYLLEDTYTKTFNPIGQGLFVRNGILFMPTGFGTEAHPSYLYAWDLKRRKMTQIIDLIKSTQGELEDCAFYKGNLILQGQKGIFKLKCQKKDAKKLRLDK